MLLRILTGELFAAKGWRVTEVTRDDGRGAVVHLEPTRMSAICSGCGETKTRLHDVKPVREWRHLDAWTAQTFVRSAVRRVRCRHCGVRVEQVPWARTRSRFTHQFEAEVLKLLRCSPRGSETDGSLHGGWQELTRGS